MSMTEREEAELKAAVEQANADAQEFSSALNAILMTADEIGSIGESMSALGIGSGRSLLKCQAILHKNVESLRALDSRKLRREFERNQQASANMLNACLAGVQIGKQSGEQHET